MDGEETNKKPEAEISRRGEFTCAISGGAADPFRSLTRDDAADYKGTLPGRERGWKGQHLKRREAISRALSRARHQQKGGGLEQPLETLLLPEGPVLSEKPPRPSAKALIGSGRIPGGSAEREVKLDLPERIGWGKRRKHRSA